MIFGVELWASSGTACRRIAEKFARTGPTPKSAHNERLPSSRVLAHPWRASFCLRDLIPRHVEFSQQFS